MAAKGFPLTLAETSPRALPTNQNGMPALITAISNLVMLHYPFPEFTWPGTNKVVCILKQERWRSKTKPSRPTFTWETVVVDLAAFESALTNGLKAMEQTHFQAELDYGLGWNLSLRHLAPLFRFIDILCVSALSELRQGHVDEGVLRMEAAIQCLGILGNEPMWVSKMARSHRAISVFDCTWQAAHAKGLQDSHLQRLQDAWRKLDFISEIPGAFLMEAAVVRNEFGQFRATNQTVYDWIKPTWAPPPPPTTTKVAATAVDVLVEMVEETPRTLYKSFKEGVYAPIWKFSWSRHDELRCLRLIEERIVACQLAEKERSAARLSVFGDSYNEAMKTTWSGYWAPLPYDFFRYFVSPRYESFWSSLERPWAAQTRRELAVAGIAVMRYQMRYGKLPASLEALVPEFMPAVPRDFMNGQVLNYQISDNDFFLHSAGNIFWPQEADPRE